MGKHRILLVLILSVFILASSFLLLKLEKKQTQLISYNIILKNSPLSADSILKTYGSTIYQISPLALQKNDSTGYSLFLESKIYSATVPKPKIRYCAQDSSLSITIHDNYVSPNEQDILDNPTRNEKLAAILLKYQ
jgi:hypothetical protein